MLTCVTPFILGITTSSHVLFLPLFLFFFFFLIKERLLLCHRSKDSTTDDGVYCTVVQAQHLSYGDLDEDLTLPGMGIGTTMGACGAWLFQFPSQAGLGPHPNPRMTSVAPAQGRNTPHHSLQSSAHLGEQLPNVGGDEEWMPRLQVHQPAQC